MGSLQGRLAAREAACRARVERLRAEIGELSARLAAEEERLSRLQITRETVEEVLAGPDLPEDIEFAQPVQSAGGETADDAQNQGGDEAVRTALRAPAASPVSSGRSTAPAGLVVPVWSRGGRADELPDVYRRVLEVLAEPSASGQGLRAKDVSEALGMGSEPRHVEGLRSKLKRLVERGWLRQVEAGRFAVAEGVALSMGPGEHGAG